MRPASPSSPLRRAVPIVFLAVLALLMGGLAPAQAAATGTVSGKVSDGSTIAGAGLVGVTVTLLAEPAAGTPPTATTIADGTYSFAAVPNGTYAVSFEKAGFTKEFFDNAATRDTDTPIVLSDTASDRSNLNAALASAGATEIGGKVTNASGIPVEGVDVALFTRSPASGGTGGVVLTPVASPPITTAPSGEWKTSVAQGDYVVQFSAAAFRSAYYLAGTPTGTTSESAATAVPVKGTAVPGLDVRLSTNTGVVFDGRVVTGASSNPVSGVQVRVEYPVTQASGQVTQELAASATTAQDGTYSLTAPTASAREYVVRFVSSGFPAVFYPQNATAPSTSGVESRAAAQRFPATNPVANDLVDLSLTAQTSVTGTVTDPTGAPVPGVKVTPVVYSAAGKTWGTSTPPIAGPATTNTEGVYKLSIDRTNTPFRLEFTKPGRSTIFFPAATVADEGTNLTVAPNQTLTARDAVLPTLSVFAGTVAEPDGSSYGKAGRVAIVRRVTYTEKGEQGGPSHTEWREVAGQVLTNAGSFSFSVPADAYRLRFDGADVGEAGFLPGLVGLDQAPDVTLGREQSLTNQKFALPAKQLLQGTVTDAAGAPLKDAQINPAYRFVENVVDGAPVLSDVVNATTQQRPATQSDGSYSVSVRKRTYRVSATGGSPSTTRFFPNADTYADADDVVVADNAVTGIDIQLDNASIRAIERPWISGLNQQGQTLTADPGTWSRDDLTFTYEWFGYDAQGAPTSAPVSRNKTFTIPTASSFPFPFPSSSVSDTYAVAVTATATGETPVRELSPRTGQVTNSSTSPDIENRQIPIVTGKAAVGETLTGTDGRWSKAGTYTYQWFAGAQAISGATTKTLAITPAQQGKVLKLRVTETSGKVPAGGEAVDSKPTVTVVAGGLRNTAAPTIAGEPKVGKTLTASPGTWSVANPTFAYQWLANGQVITGATTTTFVPTAAEVGKSLVVRVTAQSPGYGPGVASSQPTAAVASDPIVNNGLPTVSGSPVVGGTLTTTNGTWTPVPTSFAYQWLADGTAITGATASSYKPVTGDVGKRLSARVTASRADNSDGVATSTQTVAVKQSDFVNTAAPVVSGTPQAGSTLRASNGSWTPTPTSFAYQWLADGTPIAGAVAATYTPIEGNVGRRISVTVTARKDGLVDGTATSLQTAPVTEAPPEGSEPVEVTQGPRTTGTARPGNILVVDVGSYTPSSAEVTFQWLRSGVPVAGETDGSYSVGGNDLGKRLAVRVTYTGTTGDPVVRTTRPTSIVKARALIQTRVVRAKRPFTLNVRVKADDANPVRGTVQVLRQGVKIASGKLRNGQVVLRLRALKPGRQVIKVKYLGESRVRTQTLVRRVNVRR